MARRATKTALTHGMAPRERLIEARQIDVDLIDAHRFNGHARLEPGSLAELQASIRTQGILQPLIVRPLDDSGFELVAGHRRYACARALGFEEVPALVMSLNEAEAREVQLVENLQRENLAPLDEAEAIERLLELVGLDEAAARVGRSRGYLLGRMTLMRLPQGAKIALRAGTLSLSVALLLARIPDDELRAELANEVEGGRQAWTGGEFETVPLTVSEVRRAFAKTMLELKHATFDTHDGGLLEEAPSCAACPHRTGNAPDLFGDVGEKDLCTNPPCFQRKRDAAWELRRSEAEKKGYKVLPDARAKKILAPTGSPRPASGFVSPTARVGRDGDARTWQRVAKVAKAKPQTYAVRHPETDKPFLLWPVDDLRELLPREEKARLALPSPAPTDAAGGTAPADSRQPRSNAPSAWSIEVEAASEVEGAVGAAAATMDSTSFLRAIVPAFVDHNEIPGLVREVGAGGTKLPKLPEAACQKLLAIWIIRSEVGADLSAAARWFGVDAKPMLAAAHARLLERAGGKKSASQHPGANAPRGRKARSQAPAGPRTRRRNLAADRDGDDEETEA